MIAWNLTTKPAEPLLPLGSCWIIQNKYQPCLSQFHFPYLGCAKSLYRRDVISYHKCLIINAVRNVKWTTCHLHNVMTPKGRLTKFNNTKLLKLRELMGLSQQPYLHSYHCDKPADLLKANMPLQNFAMGIL